MKHLVSYLLRLSLPGHKHIIPGINRKFSRLLTDYTVKPHKGHRAKSIHRSFYLGGGIGEHRCPLYISMHLMPVSHWVAPSNMFMLLRLSLLLQQFLLRRMPPGPLLSTLNTGYYSLSIPFSTVNGSIVDNEPLSVPKAKNGPRRQVSS